MNSVTILGCRVDAIGMDAAVTAILTFARKGAGAQIVTLGTEMVVYAQRDRRYCDVVNSCALSLCDTVGLLFVARRRGAAIEERVTGVELIEHLCTRAAREGISVFLLGGSPGVAQRAAAVLQTRCPGLIVAGTRDGYFSARESASVAGSIRATGAGVLFAGMGFPRQEFWLADHLLETGCGAGIGVGGSFDVVSGNVRRAPRLWQRAGLEWMYRLVTEPQRWRRQLALPRFVLLVAVEQLRTKWRAH